MVRYLQPTAPSIENETITVVDRVFPFLAQHQLDNHGEWRLQRLSEVTRVPRIFQADGSHLWYVKSPEQVELLHSEEERPVNLFHFDAPIVGIAPQGRRCWVVVQHESERSSSTERWDSTEVQLVGPGDQSTVQHRFNGRCNQIELQEGKLIVVLEVFAPEATPQWHRETWQISPDGVDPSRLEATHPIRRHREMTLPHDYRRDLPALDANGSDVHRLIQLAQESPRAATFRQQNGVVIWPLPGDEVAHSVLLNGRLGQAIEHGGWLYCIVHTVNGSELVRHHRGSDHVETLLGDQELPLTNLDGLMPSSLPDDASDTVSQWARSLSEGFLTGGVASDGRNFGPITLHHAVITAVEVTDDIWPKSQISVSYTDNNRPGVTFVRHIQLFNEVGDLCVGDPLIELMEDLDTGRIPPERLYRFDGQGRVITFDHPRPPGQTMS